MRTSWARLAIGVAVAGGLTVATAGIASAHNLGMSGAAVCLDGGGWQATATLTLDDNPGNPPPVTGTVTASYPSGRAAQPFAVQATESATFGQGTVVPVDIPSVTFTVTGTFGDGYAFTSDVVVTQPVDCEPTTTSSTTTSTYVHDNGTTDDGAADGDHRGPDDVGHDLADHLDHDPDHDDGPRDPQHHRDHARLHPRRAVRPRGVRRSAPVRRPHGHDHVPRRPGDRGRPPHRAVRGERLRHVHLPGRRRRRRRSGDRLAGLGVRR